jgi:putative transcriptional regulator
MEPDFKEIFNLESNNVKPRKGRLLISEPFAVDEIFRRSVVLLAEYSEKEGAMGFILNKFIPKNQINKEILKNFGNKNFNFGIGGPVQINQIFYIHTLNPEKLEGSIEIVPNLYYGGNFEQLKDYLVSGFIPENQVRFFAGYSGWSAGQLENELSKNYWLVKNASLEDVFEKNNDLWVNQIKQLDEKYKIWTLVPENPVLN